MREGKQWRFRQYKRTNNSKEAISALLLTWVFSRIVLLFFFICPHEIINPLNSCPTHLKVLTPWLVIDLGFLIYCFPVSQFGFLISCPYSQAQDPASLPHPQNCPTAYLTDLQGLSVPLLSGCCSSGTERSSLVLMKTGKGRRETEDPIQLRALYIVFPPHK